MVRATHVALIAALVAGCNVLPRPNPIGGPSTLALIVVPNQNQVFVFDLQTNRVVNALTTGSQPKGVSVSPDGNQALVTNSNDGTISAYWRTSDNQFEPLGSVGQGSTPYGIAFNPNPNIREAYVAYEGDGKVLVLNTAFSRQRPAIVAALQLQGAPGGPRPAPRKIAVSPDGGRLFVTDGNNDMIHTITRSGSGQFSLSATSPLQGNPDLYGIAATRDRVFAANRAGNDLIVMDPNTNSVVGSISLASSTSSQPVQSPIVGPLNIAVNPQGTKLYVTGNAASVVSEVGVASGSLITNVPLFSGTQTQQDSAFSPFGAAVTNDGTQIYVTNQAGRNVSILSATPDLNFQAVLVKSVGTSASAADQPPLGEIAMVGVSSASQQ